MFLNSFHHLARCRFSSPTLFFHLWLRGLVRTAKGLPSRQRRSKRNDKNLREITTSRTENKLLSAKGEKKPIKQCFFTLKDPALV